MLLYWIWFAQLNKLTNGQKRQLLQRFPTPEDLYHSSLDARMAIEGITPAMLETLENKDLTEAQRILEICVRENIGILTQADPQYPARLRNTYDPPVLLYFKGVIPRWDSQPGIAVVGTRKATPYGLRNAGNFAKQIAASGGLVVSGAATGIDAAAMWGVIQADKPVVGVLGCGVDVVYPKSNRNLFEKVLERGCFLSEYPPRTEPRSWHFPERNRIITGICNGVLVVEAPEKSGAMISARCAMEQGRDVFAVPGNIDTPSCAGSNALLQDRAIPALSGWDVLKEYAHLWPDAVKRQNVTYTAPEMPLQNSETVADSREKPKTTGKIAIDKDDKSTYSVLNKQLPELSEKEKAVLEQVTKTPIGVDEVIAATGMSSSEVKAILTRLCLKKLTASHPGGRISLK